uniref:Auxin response factor n=1 Tax=Kalanchoe fedtschenkoi TaxID=63787 RepID=A0A7N0VKV3_KALFE
MFPINFPATQTVLVDSDLWKACAGDTFKVPSIDTRVYYFPEGHAELCDSPPPVAQLVCPIVPCRVLHFRFFADRTTDEVFAAVSLQPVGCEYRWAPPASRSVSGRQIGGAEREGRRIESNMKILTQSDANNGGGFSVPRQCAESIFPALNYEEDPPVQNLTITDVQGGEWIFRHIYRGTPKRHLLTTGWSKFVNNKKLVAGDTVIFMRDNLTGKLYIGIRRLLRANSGRNGKRSLCVGEAEGTGEEMDDGSWRAGSRRVSARFVEAAAKQASKGLHFEVILYPSVGLPDFVVNADVVDRALSWRWAVGTRVKMAVESEDSSRPTLLQGYVSIILNVLEGGQWRSSPWKMLQVTWIEPDHLQNVERLSPWQVEYVEHTASRQPIHLPIEVRDPHIFQPLTARTKEPRPMMGQEPHSMMAQGDLRYSGLRTRNFLNPNIHLASMQGARHLSDVSDVIGGDTHRMQNENMFPRSDMFVFRSRITEVNSGGYQLCSLPAESHSSLCSFGTEVGNTLPPGGINSIQLFGKIIYVENPVENYQPYDATFLVSDSSKGDNESEGMENQSHTS